MQTTIRCSQAEKDLIDTTARKNSLCTKSFISQCLKKYLPLNEAPIIDKNIDRTETKIGVHISKDIKDKIMDNIESVSTEFRKVKMWEIILYCAVRGCDPF